MNTTDLRITFWGALVTELLANMAGYPHLCCNLYRVGCNRQTFYHLQGPKEMSQPHKHATLIKAWADGAEIQFQGEAENWHDCAQNPAWDPYTKYRIKPEPVVVRYRRYLSKDRDGKFYVYAYNENHLYSASLVKQGAGFVKWLDCDWVTVTLD